MTAFLPSSSTTSLLCGPGLVVEAFTLRQRPVCDAEALMSVARRLPTTNRLMAVLDTDDAAAADVAVYVAALRDGRTVLSVLAPAGEARERARQALAGAGAHFFFFNDTSTTE